MRDYLLSLDHPVGRFKAAVFAGAGYHRDKWHLLQADLIETVLLEPVLQTQTEFGQKFEVRLFFTVRAAIWQSLSFG